MRIAICFSGQIRTGVRTSKNLLNFIGELLPSCDFFIHTWDVDTKRNYNASVIKNRDKNVDIETIEKIKEIYQPKKMIIENNATIINEILHKKLNTVPKNERVVPHYSFCPMWYSYMKSIEYKTEYESQNNFEYDYVVKLRFDLIINPKRKLIIDINCFNLKENEVYFENVPNNINDAPLDLEFIDDVYFFGKSKTMNILGEYFTKMIESIPNKYGMFKHIKMNNILLNNKSSYEYVIYRDDCYKFSPLYEFDKCKKCEKFYFGNPFLDKIGNENFYIDDLINNHYIDFDVYDIKLNNQYYIDEILLRRKKKLI